VCPLSFKQTGYVAERRVTQLEAGDLNGDGLPDIVAATPYMGYDIYDGTVDWFSGKADGTLGPRTVVYWSATGAKEGDPVAIAVGDVTGDGKVDLVASLDEYLGGLGRNVATRVGNGNGTFAAPVWTLYTPLLMRLVMADVTGDGKMDLLAFPSVSNGAMPSVLKGNNNGYFTLLGKLPAMNPVSALVAADFTGDGKVDVMASDVGPGVALMVGVGDGTFAAPVLEYGLSKYASDMAAVDLNADGYLDVVLADGTNVYVMLGLSGGMFSLPALVGPSGGSPWRIRLADVDHDGHQDLVASNQGSSATTFSVLRGLGTGQFAAPQTFAVGAKATLTTPKLVIADVNQDGYPDVAVTIDQNVYLETNLCAGCDDGNACTKDGWDAVGLMCLHSAVADGTSCGTGMTCTAGKCGAP
jgi:hypothetical protein